MQFEPQLTNRAGVCLFSGAVAVPLEIRLPYQIKKGSPVTVAVRVSRARH
ncbi:hypothetical protein JOB18_033899 [Solea senegalensis]|uniref:Uncharacterized protein n=1 Tax=Solea senegalensis TaxID=28829 RepID=A0AAV6RFJ6_SOLSE|nr:hypothetical protein JOB18_033899 [Solea senegalensis]